MLVLLRRRTVVCALLLLTACGPAAAPTGTAVTPATTPTVPPPTVAVVPATMAPTIGTVARTATARPAIAGTVSGSGTPRTTGVAGTAERGTGTATSTTVAAEAGAALIEQAVSQLLLFDIEPFTPAFVYGAAYDGAVAALRAAGKTAAIPPPVFTGTVLADRAAFRAAYLALATGAGSAVDQAALAHAAIREAVARADQCNTTFLDPDTYRQLQTSQQATNYAGVGLNPRLRSGVIVIAAVFPDSPAERGGVRAGDVLLAVDGKEVGGQSLEQVTPRVRGPEGTTVTLVVRRPGEASTRTFTLTRARITVPIVSSRVVADPVGEQVGYLRLYSFSAGADTQVQSALADFERAGVRGWVLDLRGNSGGSDDLLAKVASRFIPGGQPLGYRLTRAGQEAPLASDQKLTFAPPRPLAILIDDGSLGASEVLAAAAQDYGRARLFGQSTGGCVATGRDFPLSDGSLLTVTTGTVLSPTRRELNGRGVAPNETITLDLGGAADPTLDAALQWLATQP